MIITGSRVRLGSAEKEKDGIKADWRAMEKPWAVALGVERKDVPASACWCSHRNLEANYTVEGCGGGVIEMQGLR